MTHEEIGKNSERITKIKPFIYKYYWEGIIFPSEKDDCRKFEKNNLAIALKVLYAKKQKIDPAYVSKHNSNQEKQIDPKQRRMTLSCYKKITSLQRGITSKHHVDFYCLNCLHSFATKITRECHKKYLKIKIFVTLKCLLKTLKY